MSKLPFCRLWRTFLPTLFLLATIALFAKFNYPLPGYADILLWASRLDPMLWLGYARNGELPVWSWVPLLTIFFTLLLGRVFCGWLCPVGGFLAILHALKVSVFRLMGKGNSGAPPHWVSHYLGNLRIPWFLFTLAILLAGNSWPLYITPFNLLTEELSRVWRQQIPWMFLLLFFFGVAVFPRFWCMYICPTGLLFTFLSRWRFWRVSPPKSCVHCGICEKICPTAASIPHLGITTGDCLLCGRCSEKCPAGLFEITRSSAAPSELKETSSYFTRREVLRSGSALVIAGATLPLLSRTTEANPLRPPGAVEENEFLTRCSRCGRCIKGCPSQCITAFSLSSGAGLFLTPHIVPRQARCELCLQCQKVCPTGAIAHVPIPQVLMGRAVIDHSRCLGWAQGKLCLVCKEQCPQHAIDSDTKNRPSVQKEKCVGCGGCENACPVDPAAITVHPLPKRRHKTT